jgi:NADH dehydrogenase FAD-containing subunit
VYHLLNVSNKRIVIIGAGYAAFDYALNLVKKGNFVTILGVGWMLKFVGSLYKEIER